VDGRILQKKKVTKKMVNHLRKEHFFLYLICLEFLKVKFVSRAWNMSNEQPPQLFTAEMSIVEYKVLCFTLLVGSERRKIVISYSEG